MCVKAGISLFYRRGNKLSKTKKGGQIKTSISQCGGVIHSGAHKGSSFFVPLLEACYFLTCYMTIVTYRLPNSRFILRFFLDKYVIMHDYSKNFVYFAAKLNWCLKYTLTKESLVKVYFNKRLWLKYTLTKESLVRVYFNQCLFFKEYFKQYL